MDTITPFLKEGILGLLVVVESGVIALLFKLLLTEKDKRLTDAQENNTKYQQAMGEFSENSKLLLAKLDGRGQ